mmetsp:Transcript_24340/g.35153  ORF Transcript_24340/g.35153 Transcript_24340/m.35153 type:complete len:92 (+) Transcript_24340:1898-2173(+)
MHGVKQTIRAGGGKGGKSSARSYMVKNNPTPAHGRMLGDLGHCGFQNLRYSRPGEEHDILLTLTNRLLQFDFNLSLTREFPKSTAARPPIS